MFKWPNARRFMDHVRIIAGFQSRCYVMNGCPACHRNFKTSATVSIPKVSQMCLEQAVNVNAGKVAQEEDTEKRVDGEISAAVFQYASQIPFSAGLLKNMLSCLCELGFSVDDGIVMVSKCSLIAGRSRGQLIEVVMAFQQCKFSNGDIVSILRSSPEHLLIEPPLIESRYKSLRKYFSQKSLKFIFSNCPRIGLTKWDVVQDKLDYLGNAMKVPSHQIAQSKALDCPLSVIKARHMFLERAGVFKAPDPKSRVPGTNHTLSNICDTEDDYFAEKVAGLTAEEYFVFQELLTLEDGGRGDHDMEKVE